MKSALPELSRELISLSANPELTNQSRALIQAAGSVQAGEKTFTEVLGLLSNPNLEGFNLPNEAGAQCGRELARLYGVNDKCCSSCAFRLGTIPNQCATTLMTAIECCVNGETFLCHETGQPCEGWKAGRMKIRGAK